MKNIITYVRFFLNGKILICIGILFLLIRLPFLDQIYLLHDERDIVLTGYSIAYTGHDLNGNFLPLSFPDINPKTPFVAIYFTALWWLLVPIKSVFTARLLFVLVTTIFPFLIFHLIHKITQKRDLALMTTFIFCFNPWVFHMTRLVLEVNLALTFCLIGSILFLHKKRYFAWTFFILAFYTYIGYRLFIPFLVLYLELFFFITQKNKTYFALLKKELFNLFLMIILICSSLVIDGNLAKKRITEIVFFDTEFLSTDVYFKRLTSIASPFVQRIFHNKLTSSIDYIFDTFVTGLGINHLFKKGDSSAIYGSTAGGQFFIFYLPAYYFGLMYFGVKKNLKIVYPAGFALIGLFPSLINSQDVTFALRSSFSSIGFSYIIACGTILLYHYFKKAPHMIQRSLLGFGGVIVGITLFYFSYNYFFRRPITISELFFENERNLSEYLIEHPREIDYIYHQNPTEPFRTYLFLNNAISIKQAPAHYSSNADIRIGQLEFRSCGLHKNVFEDTGKSRIIFEGCLTEMQYSLMQVNPDAIKIPYQDISRKTAYFILK